MLGEQIGEETGRITGTRVLPESGAACPWLQEQAAVLRWLWFVERPAIGLQWQPTRPALTAGWRRRAVISRGGWGAATAAALAGLPEPAEAAAQAAGAGAGQFEMAFDPRFRLPLAALGITPPSAHVTVTADRAPA